MTLTLSYNYAHLIAMSDGRGLFEHANETEPRREHGYCVDDNARLLLFLSREPSCHQTQVLSQQAINFLLEGQDLEGRMKNRMDVTGTWTDEPDVGDWWGRAMWGFGAATALHPESSIRQSASIGFECGLQQRSPFLRSMTFAALGAYEIILATPGHQGARELLHDFLVCVPDLPKDATWQWPEPRLTYGNASLAEATIVAGTALQQGEDRENGLAMLRWLVQRETLDGHLSVTGVGGSGPDSPRPQFDQQPIEVAALADACWRAFQLTSDTVWLETVEQAANWFDGHNDTGMRMHDPLSGGGYDGLEANSVNINQGAESTLAFLSTMQRTESLFSSR
jgi:hypothetical protein